MTPDDFAHAHNVSRETLERLRLYADLLMKWNPAINLVARSTLDDLWRRHFSDSAQVAEVEGWQGERWADLGSGGGFPGLVVALLSAERLPARRVTLIESDQRKAAFLSTVARETGAPVDIVATRIESAPPAGAEVVSARALAPLDRLLGMVARHLAPGGRALLLKGGNYQAEVDQALETWRFTLQAYPSKTNPDSVVLAIGDIAHV